MRDFFITVGRVCFTIFIIYLSLLTLLETIAVMHYFGFFYGVMVFITGFFSIVLIGYIVSLLENIYEKTGRHDRSLDSLLSEITRLRKELNKGVEDIVNAQNIQNNTRNLQNDAPDSTEDGSTGEQLKTDYEIPESQVTESSSSGSWSSGIKKN